MPSPSTTPISDLQTRAVGLVLAGTGGFALALLLRLAGAGHRQPASLVEFGLACIAFAGFSFGGMLVSMGAGIFASVPISARWCSRRAAPTRLVAVGNAPAAMPCSPLTRRAA